jgi:putative ABC transport system permease protein
VSWQVAISTAFFLVAAFCLQGVLRESRHDSGVDVERLAVGNLDFYLAPWTEPRAREAVDRLLARARQLPSVESAAVVSGMPFGTTLTPFANLSPDGEPGKTVVDAMLIASSPGVFRTAGVAILRGRAFDERDAAGTTPVAVVSEITARALFGGRDAIGRRISVQGVTTRDRNSYTHTIVGVAADTDAQFVFHRHMGSVYLPFAQRYEPALMLIARTSGDPAALLPGLRLAASRADPDLVLGHPTTGTMAFATMYELIRIAGTGATSLAGLSLVLAMTGLYGVLSQVVSGRTREIGVRMALGAERERIRRMVLRDGLMPVMVGVVLGAGLGGLIRLALHALTPASLSAGDAVIFSLVPLPLAAGALLACYLPALRASRVDPNVALRDI